MKWGLRWEFCIILVIIFCLLFATLGLSKLGLLDGDREGRVIYSGIDDNDTYPYKVLESKLENAASKYFSNNSYSKKSNSYVTVSKLKSAGYLLDFSDGEERTCTGYAIRTYNGSVFGYVKCPKYRTEGYDASYE